MGVKSLANFNDRLRYSLGPLERVLYARFNNPIFDKEVVRLLSRTCKVQDQGRNALIYYTQSVKNWYSTNGKGCDDCPWNSKVLKGEIV